MYDERVRLIEAAFDPHQVMIYGYGSLALLIADHLSGHLDHKQLQDETGRVVAAVEAREKQLEAQRLADTERWLSRRAERPEPSTQAAATPIYVSDENGDERPNDH